MRSLVGSRARLFPAKCSMEHSAVLLSRYFNVLFLEYPYSGTLDFYSIVRPVSVQPLCDSLQGDACGSANGFVVFFAICPDVPVQGLQAHGLYPCGPWEGAIQQWTHWWAAADSDRRTCGSCQGPQEAACVGAASIGEVSPALGICAGGQSTSSIFSPSQEQPSSPPAPHPVTLEQCAAAQWQQNIVSGKRFLCDRYKTWIQPARVDEYAATLSADQMRPDRFLVLSTWAHRFLSERHSGIATISRFRVYIVLSPPRSCGSGI